MLPLEAKPIPAILSASSSTTAPARNLTGTGEANDSTLAEDLYSIIDSNLGMENQVEEKRLRLKGLCFRKCRPPDPANNPSDEELLESGDGTSIGGTLGLSLNYFLNC